MIFRELAQADCNLVLANSEQGTVCAVCSKLMKGLFYQGYYCTTCSAYIHRQCISQAANLCGQLNSTSTPNNQVCKLTKKNFQINRPDKGPSDLN